MKMLPRLCSSLDDLSGPATDRRDWVDRLGDEWPAVQHMLRSTGALASSVDCPSPGGDGCPRRVVELKSGVYRAVCGNMPADCPPLDLTRDDVAILKLDRHILADELARAFEATGSFRDDGAVVQIGSHYVYAGVGIPMFLVLREPQTPFSIEHPALRLSNEKAVLLPTKNSLPIAEQHALRERGHLVLILSEVVGLDDEGRIVAIGPPAELFGPLRRRYREAGKSSLVWPLPPGARWEDLRFEFIARDVLNVHFGASHRRLEPDTLGMRSKKNGNPTSAWTLLMSIVIKDGCVAWARTKENDRYRKQKQALSKALKAAFGLADDPIPWDELRHEYVARFISRNNIPKADLDEISSRGFA